MSNSVENSTRFKTGLSFFSKPRNVQQPIADSATFRGGPPDSMPLATAPGATKHSMPPRGSSSIELGSSSRRSSSDSEEFPMRGPNVTTLRERKPLLHSLSSLFSLNTAHPKGNATEHELVESGSETSSRRNMDLDAEPLMHPLMHERTGSFKHNFVTSSLVGLHRKASMLSLGTAIVKPFTTDYTPAEGPYLDPKLYDEETRARAKAMWKKGL